MLAFDHSPPVNQTVLIVLVLYRGTSNKTVSISFYFFEFHNFTKDRLRLLFLLLREFAYASVRETEPVFF